MSKPIANSISNPIPNSISTPIFNPLSTPIILDCDPGCDDAIAILAALSPLSSLTVEAITTVSGNASLDWIQRNARKVCELANYANFPVYAGCPRPLLKEPIDASFSHGEDGLGGVFLPEPTHTLRKEHAVDYLLQRLSTNEKPVTLAMTAPLTNIAVALIKNPCIKKNIDQIIWMGGSIGAGNITPASEYNAYTDPHALEVVLTSGIPLTMIGLDVTHQVATTPLWLEKTKALATPIGEKAAGFLEMGAQGDIERFGLTGRAIHDACVISYLLKPELFTIRPASITVELSDGPHQGATSVSTYPKHLNKKHPHFVATGVNSGKVLDFIYDCLASYQD